VPADIRNGHSSFPERTMTKQKPIRNDAPPNPSPAVYAGQQDMVLGIFPRQRLPLIILFFTVTIGSFLIWGVFQKPPMLDEYSYEVVDDYFHDSNSFTQGLIFRDGFLYESTGKYGQSKLRKIDLKEGRIVKSVDLESKYFGEGLCKVGDKLIQLTWQENTGFVYDMNLEKIDEFTYDAEGWGLTYDGTRLIMSDGTAWLYFLDPQTYEIVDKVLVRKGASRMRGINELEYINGFVYANVFGDDMIYKIQPTDGKVVGRINFEKLFPLRDRPSSEAVLNGIAIRPDNGNLLITGKFWPRIYEVKLQPLKPGQ